MSQPRSNFQELRTSMGYPDVPLPHPREWNSLPGDYSSVFYVASSVMRAVKNWQNPDVDAAWERARAVSATPDMLTADSRTGLPRNPAGATGISGQGRLWAQGPNLTADGLVTHRDSVLLIQRTDTGQLAFPGGFRDPIEGEVYGYEDALDAAVREVREETGLDLRNVMTPEEIGLAVLVSAGVAPLSLRNTDTSWIETAAYHLPVDENVSPEQLNVHPQSDAKQAIWVSFPLSSDVLRSMSDSHVETALVLQDRLSS